MPPAVQGTTVTHFCDLSFPMSKACPQLHVCLDSGFPGVSEVGREASLLGVDSWTDRFGTTG